MYEILIIISLKFVPKGPINNIPSLVQIMAWCRSGDKPLSEPMMVTLFRHQCITRLQWVKGTSPQCVSKGVTANCKPLIMDQSHGYGRHQAACREPAGSYDKTTQTAICFEHKTQYLFIRAPYTRIVVLWHISNIPPMIPQSQISCNTPTLYIAAIFVRYCYTTGSWLL